MNDSATHVTIFLCNECADSEYIDIDMCHLLPFATPPVMERGEGVVTYQCQACGKKIGGAIYGGMIDLEAEQEYIEILQSAQPVKWNGVT